VLENAVFKNENYMYTDIKNDKFYNI